VSPCKIIVDKIKKKKKKHVDFVEISREYTLTIRDEWEKNSLWGQLFGKKKTLPKATFTPEHGRQLLIKTLTKAVSQKTVCQNFDPLSDKARSEQAANHAAPKNLQLFNPINRKMRRVLEQELKVTNDSERSIV
jgi:inner membrane protein involved in colicin E2 resistance